MASKGIQAAAFGAFGLACWFGGSYYERSRGAKIYSKPVLQTVSPVQLPSADVKTDDRLAAVAKRTSEIMRFGFPSLSNIRSFDDFILSYDTRNRVAHWVFEHLTQENLKVSQNVDRTRCDFVEDKSIHPLFRATNADYKHSGFDRGHLAPAGNHRRDQRHCDQTFTLSNIAPQVGIGFNRHAWNELEKYTRRLTNKYSDVFVCTGPIYAPVYEGGKKYIKYQVLGENNVAVPTHFFKVVVMVTHDNQIHMENYLMPNTPIPEKTPLTTFLVPLETIQKLSGLLFFDETPVKSVNGKKTSFWSTIKN